MFKITQEKHGESSDLTPDMIHKKITMEFGTSIKTCWFVISNKKRYGAIDCLVHGYVLKELDMRHAFTHFIISFTMQKLIYGQYFHKVCIYLL